MNRTLGKGSRCARGIAATIIASALTFVCVGAPSNAQGLPQKSTTINNAGPSAYDVARETTVTGKVLQYGGATAAGAHLVLQTSSGKLDVHVGNPRLLTANHFSLQAGDEVTVTGENVTLGNATMFAVRMLQKGPQSLIVRSKNGMPLYPTALTANGKIAIPAGVR
jgi:DNA/RNA endonuclease YhcR with UshA esterase domain